MVRSLSSQRGYGKTLKFFCLHQLRAKEHRKNEQKAMRLVCCVTVVFRFLIESQNHVIGRLKKKKKNTSDVKQYKPGGERTALITILSHKMFVVFLTLGIWMIVGATQCPKNTFQKGPLCCDSCPPGTYLEDFCSESKKTNCKPCKDGYYADKYHVFDDCEKCQSCQQGFSQNCTATTNRKCACLPGFLCSDSDCSVCVKSNCTKDEKLLKTVISKDASGLEKYSYYCEPKCPEYEYFDPSDNKCKNMTNTQGTPTDRKPDPQSYDHIFVMMCTGFVFVSVTLVAFVFYTWSKGRRKPVPNAVQVPTAKISDFHLSMEESGQQLITHDDSPESSRFDSCDLKEVSTLSI